MLLKDKIYFVNHNSEQRRKNMSYKSWSMSLGQGSNVRASYHPRGYNFLHIIS